MKVEETFGNLFIEIIKGYPNKLTLSDIKNEIVLHLYTSELEKLYNHLTLFLTPKGDLVSKIPLDKNGEEHLTIFYTGDAFIIRHTKNTIDIDPPIKIPSKHLHQIIQLLKDAETYLKK